MTKKMSELFDDMNKLKKKYIVNRVRTGNTCIYVPYKMMKRIKEFTGDEFNDEDLDKPSPTVMSIRRFFSAYMTIRKKLGKNKNKKNGLYRICLGEWGVIHGLMYICPECAMDYEWVGRSGSDAPMSCPHCGEELLA